MGRRGGGKGGGGFSFYYQKTTRSSPLPSSQSLLELLHADVLLLLLALTHFFFLLLLLPSLASVVVGVRYYSTSLIYTPRAFPYTSLGLYLEVPDRRVCVCVCVSFIIRRVSVSCSLSSFGATLRTPINTARKKKKKKTEKTEFYLPLKIRVNPAPVCSSSSPYFFFANLGLQHPLFSPPN